MHTNMVGKTYSATQDGIDGAVVEIEASRQKALPQIHITGLPGDIVKESRERVRGCLVNLGYDVPSSRIIVHLSPAYSRKQGSQLDVAIAVSVLAAEGLVKPDNLPRVGCLGELSLDGRIRKISGAVSLIEALEKCPQVKTLLIPKENAQDAVLIKSQKVKLVSSFGEICEFLAGRSELTTIKADTPVFVSPQSEYSLDDVVGQNLAKRALQIALAGRHHFMLVGPPGVGKSMIAHCAQSLMPPLEWNELVEVCKNYDCHGGRSPADLSRPFRSPHHTISSAGLLGGGSGVVMPGEVTLAHCGILFLDEFPEFRKDAIEGLREPLQSGKVHLHRVGQALNLPARFVLITAMNPCPCGYYWGGPKRCSCT
ncbi:MAG: ATP-binding protein, partial [Deltaproteobacteria bacterium]|nr:ATP-binding protein [Deltaproteobacteria bacterium]